MYKPARQLIIPEETAHSEGTQPWLFQYSGYGAQTLNPYFVVLLIRSRHEHLDPNVTPHRRALAADNQRAIQCDVTCEAALGVVLAVAPMENHWES